jgi:hypothetical protein
MFRDCLPQPGTSSEVVILQKHLEEEKEKRKKALRHAYHCFAMAQRLKYKLASTRKIIEKARTESELSTGMYDVHNAYLS